MVEPSTEISFESGDYSDKDSELLSESFSHRSESDNGENLNFEETLNNYEENSDNYSFKFLNNEDILQSLKFEINLKEDEKEAYLLFKKSEIYEGLDIADSTVSANSYEEEEEDEDSESTELSNEYGSDYILDDESSTSSIIRHEPLPNLNDLSEWSPFINLSFWDSDEFEAMHPLSYEEIPLTEKEKSGLLTQRIVSTGLSHILLVPEYNKLVYAKLQLISKGLSEMCVLQYYPGLMYIDLSDNNIEDTEVFCDMKYLVYLNLSKNQITDLYLANAKPYYLSYLNVSFNQLQIIPDLSFLWSLIHLDLSHNKIISISGISSLSYLEKLDLSFNEIDILKVEVFSMNIKYLNLSHNKIKEYDGDIRSLIIPQCLRELNISFNQLSTLHPLKVLYWIEELDVSYNMLSDLRVIDNLINMKKVVKFNMEGNDICKMKEIKGYLIYLIPSLERINSCTISLFERLCSKELFSNSLLHRAFQVFAWLSLKRHSELLPCSLDPTFRVFNESLIVLVGPPGSGKWRIIQEIANKFPNQVRMCKLLCTRNSVSGDHIVRITQEEFSSLLTCGKIVTYEYRLGTGFALEWKELAKDGKMLLVGMELSAAMCLVWQGLAPTLLLIMPQDEQLHIQRLLEMSQDYSDADLLSDLQPSYSDDILKLGDRDNLDNSFDDANHFQDKFMSEIHSLHNTETISCDSNSDIGCSENSFQKKGIKSGLPCSSESCEHNSMSHLENVDSSAIQYGEVLDEKETELQNNDIKIYSIDISTNNTFERDFISEESKTESSETGSIEETESVSTSSQLIPDQFLKKNVGMKQKNKSMNLFVKSIIATRQQYLDLHDNMPGLFHTSIKTDNIDESARRIVKVIQHVYETKNKIKDSLSYKVQNDPMYEDTINQTKNNLMQSFIPLQTHQFQDISDTNLSINNHSFFFTK